MISKSKTSYTSFLLLFTAFLLGCAGSAEKEADFGQMTEKEQRQMATDLAQKFIMVDGHVDLPYRMKKKGFMITKEVEDVSIETSGNFDYPKSKRGGLDAPFMSIYVPSGYQVSGGAKAFADSLIDMVSRIPVAFPDMFALANTPEEVQANFDTISIRESANALAPPDTW